LRGWPAGGAAALALCLGGTQAARAEAPAGPVIPVPCSTSALAGAISGAPYGATLSLAPSCTYTLTAPLPVIGSTLTINGNNDRIQRPSSAPPFSLLTNDAALTVTHLTLTGGRYVEGRAILNAGLSLTVIDCYLAGNTATGFGGGGAILNGSSLTLVDSTLTGNVSTLGGGGAVASNGSFTAINDTFTGNAATNRTPADGYGGAVFAFGYVPEGGPDAPARVATARPAGSPQVAMTMTGGTVTGNYAGENGGGIAVFDGAVIRNTLLGANRARLQGAGLYNGGSSGPPGSPSIPTTVANTQVTRNSAGADGGGIYSDDPAMDLSGSTRVSSNEPDNCAPAGSIPGCLG
jgi:predicted outer membrane repeat protein